MIHSKACLKLLLCSVEVVEGQFSRKFAFDRFWSYRMSRPMALGLVLLVLILTSQSEWKQQPKNELESTAAVSKQQQMSTKRELIKEQIILSQEKKIYILNELVKGLRQQLAQCQENTAENVTEVASMDVQNESARSEEDV